MGFGHSFISRAQRQQAAGAAQVGPQAAGAAHVGAQAAGAAHEAATVPQPLWQQLLRILQHLILGKQSFGILKQCDFLQQLLQPVLQQLVAGAHVAGAAHVGAQAAGAAQVGAQAAGAAHVGAQAAGAAQLGAHAAGAAQLGAGAAHDGAGAHPQP